MVDGKCGVERESMEGVSVCQSYVKTKDGFGVM